MKKYALILFLSGLTLTLSAQEVKNYSDKVKTLDSTIKTLYDVISGEKDEERDWKLFKFLFKPDAKLIPSGKNDEGDLMVRYMKPDDYVKNSGKWLVANGFYEKEIRRRVNAYGNIAQVFSTYEAFKYDTGDKPFMRGINSIQLLNDGKRWWIINIYWTQETKDNPIPKKYLRK